MGYEKVLEVERSSPSPRADAARATPLGRNTDTGGPAVPGGRTTISSTSDRATQRETRCTTHGEEGRTRRDQTGALPSCIEEEAEKTETEEGEKGGTKGETFVSVSEMDMLRRVVEEQAQEIERLRARLAGTRVEPRLDERVLQAGEMVTDITGDRAVGLAFPALVRGLTTKEDVRRIRELCITVSGEDGWEALFQAFYETVVQGRENQASWVREREMELEADWFKEPWYLMYAQWIGIAEGGGEGDFDSARKALGYIRGLGFRNICLLPHYESPMADGGYDVSDYVTRESLGGEEGFDRFMQEAHSLGMRVVTDAVFNHTSTEHKWFQRALEGDERYLGYYVQRNGREKIGEFDRGGDIVCRYRDPDGTITERVVVFPDIDRTHGLWAEINGKTYQFYRSFLPCQVDLNLRNACVMREVFEILAGEVGRGVLGKRVDAAGHWVKKAGEGEGLAECHAVLGLVKSFLRHLCRVAVVLPEIVCDAVNAASYGEEGDGILGFEMQACLRECVYFQAVGAFWRGVFRAEMSWDGTWINLLEHHDESFLGFYPREVRRWMGEFIKSHGGIVYKNGMAGCGRVGECLDGNEERIATGIFVLYVARGVPMIYAGLESGIGNGWKHARESVEKRKRIFDKLGVFCGEGFDERELHRGGIEIEKTSIVRDVVKRLNEIWGSLGGSNTSPRPIDCGDVGVIACERNGRLCIANLTPSKKKVRMAKAQLETIMCRHHHQVRDVLHEQTTTPIEITIDGPSLVVEIQKFGRCVLY